MQSYSMMTSHGDIVLIFIDIDAMWNLYDITDTHWMRALIPNCGLEDGKVSKDELERVLALDSKMFSSSHVDFDIQFFQVTKTERWTLRTARTGNISHLSSESNEVILNPAFTKKDLTRLLKAQH